MTWAALSAGIISLVVSVFGTYFNYVTSLQRDRQGLQDKHEWEQRAKLRNLVSKYHGRVLEAAVDWDRRMGQLYDGSLQWLQPKDVRSREEYFFHSVVYRFLTLRFSHQDRER